MVAETVVEAWGGRYDGLHIVLSGNPSVLKISVAVPMAAYLFSEPREVPLQMRVEVYPIVILRDGRRVVVAPSWWPGA